MCKNNNFQCRGKEHLDKKCQKHSSSLLNNKNSLLSPERGINIRLPNYESSYHAQGDDLKNNLDFSNSVDEEMEVSMLIGVYEHH